MFELDAGWAAAGLPGLFLACFLAATLLPLSSELVLALMMQGPWDSGTLFLVATAGNTLGGCANFAAGRWIGAGRAAHWLRIDPGKAARWTRAVERHGAWVALLCWLPVVGDPLALALGLARVPVWPVVMLMALGKAARYAALIGLLT